jgi:hypothetical protein
LDCNLYWQAPAVFPIRNLLDPTIGQHDLQIPGQRGWVEVQTLPKLNTPNGADLCYGHQKSQLCGFQTEGPEFMIVDAHENTVEYACTPQQALTRYTINNILILFHSVFDSIFIRAYCCIYK